MAGLRYISNTAIVFLFALCHFGVALVSRTLHYYDDIPLTILTILMVIVVAMNNRTRVDIMAILTMVATLLGFVIGSWLRGPMEDLVQSDLFAPAVSTFIITMVLGISIDIITIRVKRLRSIDQNISIRPKHIVAVGLSILILRMGYVVMDRAGIFTENMLLDNILNIVVNSWALLLLLAGNIVLTIHISKQQKTASKNSYTATLVVLISSLVIPLLTTLIVFFDVPYFSSRFSTLVDFVQVLSAALLIDLIIITICYLVHMSIVSHQRLREEREQKHRSEYQYERLKQQINPHFLFNSLGILDYLVQEQETERARAFIHKLAGMYRYMLSNDQKPLVKLSEELDFTGKYIDLIKERFTEGVVTEINIPSHMYDSCVVPCALQLLVENATKHNVVSPDMPLTISIVVEDEWIVVRNNLQERTHGQPSTYLGLENIRRQYQDITGSSIVVEKSEREFIVKLPIV
ncbi:MAG: histidine kinase [Alistipes sp.]|nr:histidine kinase [Alistipes sp.]